MELLFSLGGQTALKLAKRLTEKGIRIIGTSFDNMDIAEDRGRFSDMLKELEIPYPRYGTAHDSDEAIEIAQAGWLSCFGAPELCFGRTKNAYCFE